MRFGENKTLPTKMNIVVRVNFVIIDFEDNSQFPIRYLIVV
tara:strand:- start:666 stop:788 length:123 start_codon:yes stop_codon:yes gene_type:complete